MEKQRGFTLIELLIVLVIIYVLAMIAVSQFAKYREKGFDATTITTLRHAGMAQEAYFVDNQTYTMNVNNLLDYGLVMDPKITIIAVSADRNGHEMEASHVDSDNVYITDGNAIVRKEE
jgi:prepilin-type N-terminal cleavage/methylation domain-containing protein